jgi:glycyl-tRNA synthetase (class II)
MKSARRSVSPSTTTPSPTTPSPVRERNTMTQERIALSKVAEYLRGKMKTGA